MRVQPLQEPYEEGVGETLRSMMPPGIPPIALFRTLARNPALAESMRGWGSYELGKSLSVGMRTREIAIDRTCARCGCEYEWGVHVAFFAERVGLDEAQVRSLTHGGADDPCWREEGDRLVVRLADALHDSSTVDDALWSALAAEFSEAQLLDLILLVGWYHAISYVARATGVSLEEGAPRFSDYR